ncbi:MAG: hypothetical protein V4510_07230 [bacterium]
MRIVLIALLGALVLAGCSSSSPGTGSSSEPGATNPGHPGTSDAPSTTTTTQPPSTTPSSSSSSTSSTTTTTSAPPANATKGAPAPVSVECTFAGGGQTFAGPSVTLTCTSPDISSSTGGPFTKGHAKATFSGAPPSSAAVTNTFSVADADGNAMGSATGDSPIEFDLTAIPGTISFTLAATLKATGPTVNGMDTVTGTTHFDLS